MLGLAATVTRAAGQEGVLYASGNLKFGLSVFVQNQRPVVEYNAVGEHVVLESDREVPLGDTVLSVHLRRVEGFAGTLALSIDGAVCGHAEVPLVSPSSRPRTGAP